MAGAKFPKERIGLVLKTALQAVHDSGGQLRSSQVVEEVQRRIKFSDYELEKYEKSGYVRWESILHFYSIDCCKAGWLVKRKGLWYITPEGISSLSLQPLEFVKKANEKYREWRAANPREKSRDEVVEAEGEDSSRPTTTAFDKAVSLAREEIIAHIQSVDAYKYQDMVAALLNAMGYHTPFVAPKGKDGGVDILAYRDPFGSQAPRIKVQVKHRSTQKVTVQEVRELAGLLNKDGDTGLFVSTGGFTDDAVAEMRRAARHIEKVDLDNFIDMWEEYYDKLEEEHKYLLPLRRLSFLAAEEL